jgi:hypothetical protein
VLLVLDDTANQKLEQLVQAFEASGGEAHLGDAVWEHVAKRSGKEIANFVAKYVREPIVRIDRHSERLLSMSIEYKKDEGRIVVSVGKQSWAIRRLDVEMDDDEG